MGPVHLAIVFSLRQVPPVAGLTELVESDGCHCWYVANPLDDYNAIDIALLRDVCFRPVRDAGQTVEREMEEV